MADLNPVHLSSLQEAGELNDNDLLYISQAANPRDRQVRLGTLIAKLNSAPAGPLAVGQIDQLPSTQWASASGFTSSGNGPQLFELPAISRSTPDGGSWSVPVITKLNLSRLANLTRYPAQTVFKNNTVDNFSNPTIMQKYMYLMGKALDTSSTPTDNVNHSEVWRGLDFHIHTLGAGMFPIIGPSSGDGTVSPNGASTSKISSIRLQFGVLGTMIVVMGRITPSSGISNNGTTLFLTDIHFNSDHMAGRLRDLIYSAAGTLRIWPGDSTSATGAYIALQKSANSYDIYLITNSVGFSANIPIPVFGVFA